MDGTLDLGTTYYLSNQVQFVVEAETLCSRTFFFYDFLTLTVPCDQIFAIRPPIFFYDTGPRHTKLTL